MEIKRINNNTTELKMKINKGIEQLSYEFIMSKKNDVAKVLFYILAEPDTTPEALEFIIQDWKDKEIWPSAISFFRKMGDKISYYNGDVLSQKEVQQILEGK